MTAHDDAPILSLRCGDAQWRDCPDTLDAFARPARLPSERRDLAAVELLVADHHARRWLGLEPGRRVLTCETARFGAAAALERSNVDLAEWTRFDELHGEVLVPDPLERSLARARPSALAMRVRQSLVAIAAAVPMLTVSIAEASPPDARLIVAAPPPKLPSEAGPRKPDADPVPVVTTEPAPTTEAPVMPDAPPPVVVPPPVVRDDSLSLTGRNLWDGLEDKAIILVMKDGSELIGSVVAHSAKDLAFVRASDGAVVAVPKAEISGIRVRRIESGGDSPRPRGGGGPADSGNTLSAGGGAMIGIGSAAALAGTVMLGIYVSALYISLPLLLPGLAMVGGGAAMLAAGKKRKAAYDKAWGITSGRHRVMPTASASRQGGHLGLVLRF